MENTQITQTIISTINSILETLFSSIDNNLYSALDDITFISSDILNDKNFENIFGTASSNGILLISNSLLIAFILYFSIRYLLSHLIYTKIDNPIGFIIKLIIFGIGMNFSFFIIKIILDLNSNISLSIRNLGEYLFNKNICFSELITNINSSISINTNSLDVFSLDGLIKTTLTISLLNLVFSYSFRYIMIEILVLLSPFSILCLTLDSTKIFFNIWLKNLFSLLFIQIIVSLVLVVLFAMDYSSSNLFSKFIYIGGIYALIKANSFVRDFLGGISTDITSSVHNIFRNGGTI